MLSLRPFSNAAQPFCSGDGTPHARARIIFNLVDANGKPVGALEAGADVSGIVRLEADDMGVFTTALWPNDRGNIVTQWHCRVIARGGAVIHDFIAGIPSGSTTLSWQDFVLGGQPLTVQQITVLDAHIGNALVHVPDPVQLDIPDGYAVVWDRANGTIKWVPVAGVGGGGTGDVTGPGSATNNHVAVFDGATGKLIKDSGFPLSGNNTGDQDLSGLQPKDQDLTDIAALAPVQNDFLIRGATAWISKTVAQVKTLLGLGSAAYTASTDYATSTQGANADTHAARTDNPHSVTAAQVGAYTTGQMNTALAGKADLVGGLVPANQLPSYVDDVLEYANLASFPGTGETGKIYVALDTNLTYRWSGSTYAALDPSLALGETATTAYRGDRGKIAYDHSQSTGNPHGLTLSDIGAQAASSNLTALAGLAGAADKLAYFTAAGAMALTTITAGARLLLAKAFGSANQVLGVNAAGTDAEYKTLTAGKGMNVTHSAGAITLDAVDGFISIDITAAGPNLSGTTYTIDSAQALNKLFEFTGTIGANWTVVFPAAAKDLQVENLTSGAYTVAVKTPSGTGYTFATTEKTTQGLYCNGTNIEDKNNGKAGLNIANTFNATQTGSVIPLTSTSGSIAIDLGKRNNFSHTMTENTTLAAPSNAVAGTSGQIAFTQHASAAKTLAFDAAWVSADGTTPAISTTVGAVNVLTYYVVDSTHIWFALNKHGVA